RKSRRCMSQSGCGSGWSDRWRWRVVRFEDVSLATNRRRVEQQLPDIVGLPRSFERRPEARDGFRVHEAGGRATRRGRSHLLARTKRVHCCYRLGCVKIDVAAARGHRLALLVEAERVQHHLELVDVAAGELLEG